MRDEDVTVDVDAPYLFFARNRTTPFFLKVLSALKETVSPDLVLNFTRVGFFTVLTATNLTFCFVMPTSYHRSLYFPWRQSVPDN